MKFKSSHSSFALFFFTILFSSGKIFSQDADMNDAFYSKALQNSMAFYHQSFGSQSALYNGPTYNGYLFRFKEGHPYFFAEAMTIGSVTYDGIRYDSVLMQYDEIADILVVRNPEGKIRLWDQKVTSFHLYNSEFVLLEKDSGLMNAGNPRFYNQLYKGKITLLKKEIKIIREEISSANELLRFADQKDHYYIIKDGHWNQVNSRKDFYKILGEKGRDVKQFVKTNKLSFRQDRQNMLTRATAYYDSLK